MRVIRLPETFSGLLENPKPTLLVQTSRARAVMLPLADYERLVAVYDWHERMLKGA